MPGKLPSTIEKSDKHAQHLYEKTLRHAEKEYGNGRRAHMTAYASLKHEYKKKGDRWVRK